MTSEDIYNKKQITSGDLKVSMITKMVRYWQEGNGLSVDGYCGPNTQSSLSSTFANIRGVSDLSEAALSIAIESLGEGETGGNNSGPFVEMLHGLEFDGDDDDDGAWCAAFVSYCFKQASARVGQDIPFSPSGGAKRLYKNISNAGVVLSVDQSANGSRVLPGDVICFHRGDPSGWMGHIGIVERVSPGVIYTIEGNVGSYPSKVRRFRRQTDDPMLMGFARI